MNTASTLPIETLSISDKLLLMERLWEDLSRRPSDIPPPDWHGDILAERQAASARAERRSSNGRPPRNDFESD